MTQIKAVLVQMGISADKGENLAVAGDFVAAAAEQGADLVVLPEMFLCPYEARLFPLYSEPEGGAVWERLSELSRRLRIYLVAGSVPERDEEGRIYNTSWVFDRQGRQIARHRKAHLFDIDVQGGQSFRESDTLSAGDKATVFQTEFGPVGLAICYDFRFPELSRAMVDAGAKVIAVPAAFNMTTGPAHWEVLFRSRAIDNQVYTLGAAPARDRNASYHSWGHSIAVSPWGDVIGQLDEKEGALDCVLDLDRVDAVRSQLPLLAHRKPELYRRGAE